MAVLLTTDDFDGYFAVPQSVAQETATLLQEYIDRYEKRYIYSLLGVTLGDLFIADLAMVSRDPIYAVIEDEIHLDDPDGPTSGCQFHSRGMLNMLKAFVFYEFVFNEQAFMTLNGVAVNINEAQTIQSPENAARYAEAKFNEAIEDYKTIQWYVDDYQPDDYPDYNGIAIKPRYSAIF